MPTPSSQDSFLDTNLAAAFPILQQKIYQKSLIYLDNAATTQKPIQVIQALQQYYEQYNANIHRAAHTLSSIATRNVEDTRAMIQQWINAATTEEIIFTQGTTAAINLVAQTYAKQQLNAGDEILISLLEHHANIVPWQMLAQEKGVVLKVIPVKTDGTLDMDAFDQLLTAKTKMVALVHISSTLGIINPIEQIIQKAHARHAVVLIDGAQSIAHMPIDVQQWDVDFFVFSAHKAYGPTGLGILYGKKQYLEMMPPYQGGGGMVAHVTTHQSKYQPLPYKLEAGTPPIASICAFQEAIRFIQTIGYTKIQKIEHALLVYAQELLQKIPAITLYGTTDVKKKIGIIALNVQGMHHLDVGLLLDARGIAVRTGLLCTQPLIDYWQVDGMVRISLAVYNTFQDIAITVQALKNIIQKHGT